MIRILICDYDASERLWLRNACERLSGELGVPNVEITQLPSLAGMRERVSKQRADLYDLLICRMDADTRLAADEGAPNQVDLAVQALRELRGEGLEARIVLISSLPEHAVHAFDLEASGMLLASGTYEAFRDVMAGPLQEAATRKSGLVCVKSRQGLDNVELDSILFVESTKRGPLIHLPANKTVLVPGSLQALFERLSEDERFAKAGSSFIVNLDNVRSLGERSVIFADGEAIVVPVRANKPLRESLAGYRSR